jgi:hypothetical protein
MLARVLAANVVFGWFAADAGYGRDPGLRAFCHDNTIAYVMAVPVDLPLVDARGKALCCKDVLIGRTHSWERRSVGADSKGARLGLDQYQVRKRTPWYRHVTMCMLA